MRFLAKVAAVCRVCFKHGLLMLVLIFIGHCVLVCVVGPSISGVFNKCQIKPCKCC